MHDQTSATSFLRQIFFGPLPGGASWRKVWGGLVLFLFLLQVLTGLLLMTVYSPSTTTAWSSIWYIQTQVPAGWLIRGLHHFGSDAFLIIIVLHGAQIVITRTYRPPRASTWWITLGLLGLALALSLSGHLLPWDQGGYWGTTVRTNILAKTPLIGGALRRLLIGGSQFGHLTLTHFHTLHVMLLPGLVALLIWVRWAVGRRRRANLIADKPETPTEPYWPGQCFRDSLAFAAVFAVLMGIILYTRYVSGTELLDAPADPTASDYPARPEWHTLFLFQWLKYFEGPTIEMVGAIIAPSLIMAVFFAFPFLDRLVRPRAAYGIILTFTSVIMLAAGWLTYAAVRADRDPPVEQVRMVRDKLDHNVPLSEAEAAVLRAQQFNRRRKQARRLAARAIELADKQGIPSEGPLELLANDPLTQGPKLFAANCASCHRYDGHDGLGNIPREPPDSSDLAGYATRSWVRSLLANPMADRHFGRMTN